MDPLRSPPPGPPPSTLRRNPPRRAKQLHTITPYPQPELEPEPKLDPKPKPKPEPKPQADKLRVFLRVRPLEIRPKPVKGLKPKGRAKAPSPKKAVKSRGESTYLVVNDSSSVTLMVPTSVSDAKRSKTEVYDGFSHVFPQDSSQEDVFEKAMDPIIMDFISGKDALLVAMGPTGSGKTHTMFGSQRDPGILPLTLRRIFSHSLETGESQSTGEPQSTRSYYLSMFEISSERGKGERIFDLLLDGADMSLQQLSVKGRNEVRISNATEAEGLVALGLLKRSTAATNANDQSSRSQCIINIRSAPGESDDENACLLNGAVLTIADLAGSEKEKKTGNQGAKLSESNFINNTSMVFGLCLRSLLEHQKNPKKSFEKHCQNSLLTRYLRDYLEGKKRMTLILTVKPGENDYLDTSFLLRQASPFMKIRFNNTEDTPNTLGQKRNTSSFIRTEHHKRRRCVDAQVSKIDCGRNEKDTHARRQKSEKVHIDPEVCQEIETEQTSSSSVEPSRTLVMDKKVEEFRIQLGRMERSDELMKNITKSFWNLLKQYKNKLEESESDVRTLRKKLRHETNQVMELKCKLKEAKSCCLCQINPSSEELRGTAVSLTSPVNSNKRTCKVDKDHITERVYQSPESSSVSIHDDNALGLKSILHNKNLTERRKTALPSLLERSSIMFGKKLAGSMADCSPRDGPHGEDITLRTSFDVNLASVVNSKDSGEADLSSPVSSSGHDFSMLGQSIRSNEDDKIVENIPQKEDPHEDTRSLTTFDLSLASNAKLIDLVDSTSLVNSFDLSQLENTILTKEDDRIADQIADSHPGKIYPFEDSKLLTDSEFSLASKLNLIDSVEDDSGSLVSSSGPDNSLVGKSILTDEDDKLVDQITANGSLQKEDHHEDNSSLTNDTSLSSNADFIDSVRVNPNCQVSSSGREPVGESMLTNEDQKKLEKCVTEKTKSDTRIEDPSEKHEPTSKPTKPKKSRRRLLPASGMLLLKDITTMNIDDDGTKENRGKPSAEERGRSEGSISLIHLMKKNHWI